MARPSDSQAGIQQLLQAEQQAQAIVAKAKQDKNLLLKRAREESEKDIAVIRAQREAQFQDYVKTHIGSKGEHSSLLAQKADAEITQVQQQVAAKQADVVKLLLSAVSDVYTETVTTTSGQKILA